MADLQLDGFSSLVEGSAGAQVVFEVVIRPFMPASAFTPVMEDLTTEGVSGYRSRIVHAQNRRAAVEALSGEATASAVRLACERLLALEGSYGTARFSQAGQPLTYKNCQIRNILASPVNARLSGVDSDGAYDYDYCLRASFDLVLPFQSEEAV